MNGRRGRAEAEEDGLEKEHKSAKCQFKPNCPSGPYRSGIPCDPRGVPVLNHAPRPLTIILAPQTNNPDRGRMQMQLISAGLPHQSTDSIWASIDAACLAGNGPLRQRPSNHSEPGVPALLITASLFHPPWRTAHGSRRALISIFLIV